MSEFESSPIHSGDDHAGSVPGNLPVRGRGDPTPQLGRGAERFVRIFAVVTLLYSAYYIYWRWGYTLNWDAWWFSIPLVLAEMFILFSATLTTFTIWKLNRRDPPPPLEDADVDVFITTYDEPIEIIRRTALGARSIRYPHRTFILDDGGRDGVRKLAAELGIGYIRRDGSEHAKAGNLNHALKQTTSDFILQLDADHVPLPYILDRLLGFFRAEDVAFVQSPQDFYNTDSFSYDVNEKARRLWEEQRIFFSLIQPGKDNWNAAFFCGSCGILRREAIEEIGGFAVETITEDMETSLVLHSRGWKSVYYAESLAYGLAPASAGQYMVQRLRWGQGSMQILRKYNPLFRKGLTWPQRLAYFDSTISYLDGPAKVVLYLAPVVFFFTGILPIWVDQTAFLVRFIPYLVLNVAMFELLFRGTGFLLIAERYNMAKFWIYTVALSGFFARGKLKFEVTPKSRGEVPFRSYAPQLILLILTGTSAVFASLAYPYGWIDYDVPGWGSGAFLFNFVWAAYNFYFAAYVVRLSLDYRQQRVDERFRATMPVRGELLRRGTGTAAAELVAGELVAGNGRMTGSAAGPRERGESESPVERIVVLTTDLNPDGLGFRFAREIEQGSRVRFSLPLESGPVDVEGTIVHRELVQDAQGEHFEYGVDFDPLDPQRRDAIDLHCTQHAVPLQRVLFRDSTRPLESVRRILTTDPRRSNRQTLRVPTRITYPDGAVAPGDASNGEHLGYLEEISQEGARLIVSVPPPPGGRVRFTTGAGERMEEGEAVAVHAMHTPMGVLFSVGLRRDADSPADEAKGTSWYRRFMSQNFSGTDTEKEIKGV